MGNMVDTVENRIQNPISTAIVIFITSKIELAVTSKMRLLDNVTVILERGERVGIIASFENLSERNNTLHVLNTNDESGKNIPDETSEISAPGTQFDRQSYTHHSDCHRRQFKHD